MTLGRLSCHRAIGCFFVVDGAFVAAVVVFIGVVYIVVVAAVLVVVV